MSADGDIEMKSLIGTETGRAHVNGADIAHAVPTHEISHDQQKGIVTGEETGNVAQPANGTDAGAEAGVGIAAERGEGMAMAMIGPHGRSPGETEGTMRHRNATMNAA